MMTSETEPPQVSTPDFTPPLGGIGRLKADFPIKPGIHDIQLLQSQLLSAFMSEYNQITNISKTSPPDTTQKSVTKRKKRRLDNPTSETQANKILCKINKTTYVENLILDAKTKNKEKID